MEMNKPEVAAVVAAAARVEEAVRDLNDLELSLIGGGIGDVVFG